MADRAASSSEPVKLAVSSWRAPPKPDWAVGECSRASDPDGGVELELPCCFSRQHPIVEGEGGVLL